MSGYEAWSQIVSSPSGIDRVPLASVPYLSPPDIPATTAAAPQAQRTATSDAIATSAEDDLHSSLTIIARHAVRQGADCCIVWSLSADEHQLQPLAFSHRDPRQEATLHRRLLPMPVDDNGRSLVEALGTDHGVPETKPARNVFFPLHREGQDLGIVEIIVASGTWPPTVHSSETMQQLANQAALTIENARLRQKLDQAELQLREYPGRLLIARERERKRIAYDIHDGLAQFATAAHQHLQAVAHAQRLRDPETRRQLFQVMKLLQQAILEARAIIADVPPPTLHELGLAAAIHHQVVALTNNGRECTFEDAIGAQRFSEAVELALFRTAQEALTNIRKHAGPTPVRVTLTSNQRNLCLVVQDWGCGFREGARADKGTRQHIGLMAMRDRITLLGGWISIDSIPGEGTCITATIPAGTMKNEGDHHGNQHIAAAH